MDEQEHLFDGLGLLGDEAAAPAPVPAQPSAPGPGVVGEPAVPAAPVVEIRPSARRRRTVTAYREGDRTVVLVPARMSRREQERYAAELVERLDKRDARARRSDDDLVARAAALSQRFLDGAAVPTSVRWVGNQRARWGSCTPLDGTIRLSDRMRDMPDYVVDAVLLHELAHLLEPGHGPAFQALVRRHPEHERAQAYLEGAAFGQERLAAHGSAQPGPTEPDSTGSDGAGSDSTGPDGAGPDSAECDGS